MSNICKTVSLRTRKIKDGHMLSYYLDYYPGYRDESTMKVIRHESLGIYIYAKPKNQTEQKYNLNLTARAEAIRCRRFEAIVNERYELQVATRLYALSYLHARQVYLRGDKRGLVQQISGVSADSTTGTA